MDKRYTPADHQTRIYQLWQEHDCFNPDSVKPTTGQQFSIIMPPPNANDPLHIGHAMFLAIEDVLIRYHRMKGDDTVWIPGTDHAGIETQFVYEKKLKKQGKSRFQFDRATLYQQIWEYVQENSGIAIDQMKQVGASADWSRFKFMLDDDITSQVLETFKKLHADGLIYRDLQLVNYSPAAGTSYSELEIKYAERTSPLYYIKYRKTTNPQEFVTVATTRPELIFADTHLAVHPDDSSKKDLIGAKLLNPLTNAEMEVIADEFVDPKFGTGVVKLTPAHDFNDFEVGKKHGLPIIQAIDTTGKIMANGGKYAGLKVKKAREEVVKDLEAKGLIDRVDNDYQNRVATCYKTGQDIEPLPLPQFFIKVKPLVEPVIKALDEGEIVVHGSGHDKILRHWLTNLRDWNISRQIVWGIQIPVWYDVSKYPEVEITFIDDQGDKVSGTVKQLLAKGYGLEKITLGLQELRAPANIEYEISPTQPGEGFLSETDTFDTWFSSGQWPVTTLRSTKQGDFERFYPTTVMETGYDILPFWVMRMLMLGKYLTGEFPFHDVYLHGLVRDQHGRKMSKSKGNVINPLEIIEQYGADAFRMALVIRSTPGIDKSIGKPDFKAARNLTNKLWNAARFVLMNHDKVDRVDSADGDEEFLEKLQKLITIISDHLDSYRLGLAADELYNQFWHWYCDECIERGKAGQISQTALEKGLVRFLKLFHPFMPFVTEAIWQELPSELKDGGVLMVSGWKVGT